MKLQERGKGNTARVDPRKRIESGLDVNDCDDDDAEEIAFRAENYVYYIHIGLRYVGCKDSTNCKLHQSMRLSSVLPEGLRGLL